MQKDTKILCEPMQMERKAFLDEVRRLHPDKGGSTEEFQKFMEKRKQNKNDIFQQDDVFCRRRNIDSDDYHMTHEFTENGIIYTEKVTFKKDNTVIREVLHSYKL